MQFWHHYGSLRGKATIPKQNAVVLSEIHFQWEQREASTIKNTKGKGTSETKQRVSATTPVGVAQHQKYTQRVWPGEMNSELRAPVSWQKIAQAFFTSPQPCCTNGGHFICKRSLFWQSSASKTKVKKFKMMEQESSVGKKSNNIGDSCTHWVFWEQWFWLQVALLRWREEHHSSQRTVKHYRTPVGQRHKENGKIHWQVQMPPPERIYQRHGKASWWDMVEFWMSTICHYYRLYREQNPRMLTTETNIVLPSFIKS